MALDLGRQFAFPLIPIRSLSHIGSDPSLSWRPTLPREHDQAGGSAARLLRSGQGSSDPSSRTFNQVFFEKGRAIRLRVLRTTLATLPGVLE
jgi:hypothetical protein